MDEMQYVTIEKSEYDYLLKKRQEASLLKHKIDRLNRNISFHSLTAENLERIRDFNDMQKDEYYLYNVLILKNCPGHLFFFDSTLNFVLASEVGLRETGHAKDTDLKGMPFADIFSKMISDTVITDLQERCEKVLVSRKSLRLNREIQRLDTDALSQFVIDISPALNDQDNCMGVVLVFNDVTELAAEREKAINASKAKSIFLANMSHDIRTPMNAVIGMSELLMAEELTEKQADYARDILMSATSLTSLINDILDLSKIEDGKLNLSFRKYSLPQMLENVNSMFRYSAKQKGIDYVAKAAPNIPAIISGDETRVRQILNNVIGNAIKFTAKGTVAFDTYIDNHFLCFDIADTGTGIRKEDMHHLFLAFSQLDEELHRHIGGTGLGLSITKSLVEMMNGTIDLESTYGEGSVFHIRLPLVASDEKNVEPVPELRPFAYIKAPSADILVVDDNLVNLKVAKNLLKLCDIETDTATSGMEAIDKIKHKHYDIVFLDHMMPELDGVETAKMLRSSGYDKNKLTLIALSANAIEGAREMFLESGMQDFLVKPIDKILLNMMLEKWLPPEKIIQPPSPEDKFAQELEELKRIKALNIDLALEKANGDASVCIQRLTVLVRNIPLIESSIISYGDDPDKLVSLAKGLCEMLENAGAQGLLQIAQEIERRAEHNNLSKCGELFPVFLGVLSSIAAEAAPILGEKPISQVH